MKCEKFIDRLTDGQTNDGRHAKSLEVSVHVNKG